MIDEDRSLTFWFYRRRQHHYQLARRPDRMVRMERLRETVRASGYRMGAVFNPPTVLTVLTILICWLAMMCMVMTLLRG